MIHLLLLDFVISYYSNMVHSYIYLHAVGPLTLIYFDDEIL